MVQVCQCFTYLHTQHDCNCTLFVRAKGLDIIAPEVWLDLSAYSNIMWIGLDCAVFYVPTNTV